MEKALITFSMLRACEEPLSHQKWGNQTVPLSVNIAVQIVVKPHKALISGGGNCLGGFEADRRCLDHSTAGRPWGDGVIMLKCWSFDVFCCCLLVSGLIQAICQLE